MKLLVLSLLIMVLISSASAVRINEVEMNPSEGNEWVELYNDDENDLDISGWEIWEGIVSAY